MRKIARYICVNREIVQLIAKEDLGLKPYKMRKYSC